MLFRYSVAAIGPVCIDLFASNGSDSAHFIVVAGSLGGFGIGIGCFAAADSCIGLLESAGFLCGVVYLIPCLS